MSVTRWYVWGWDSSRGRWSLAGAFAQFISALKFAIKCELTPGYWNDTLILPKREKP